jgi:[acyl-carrier-protein] S-malonyltransferase
LPDTVARMELGSVAASVLREPLARALFVRVTAAVDVSDADVKDYHARNPARFGSVAQPGCGWRSRVPAPFDEVRPAIAEHLRAAARRRAFRRWLDARCAELVELAPGYEHPGDPRQPDNTHRH